jgi:hypothetical protein
MSFLSNLRYFFIALIILVLGYFFGTIILLVIFAVILLIFILFLLAWVFNRLVDIFTNKQMRLLIKMMFSSSITVGAGIIFWKLFSFKLLASSSTLAIVLLWTINVFIFSILWHILHIKKRGHHRISQQLFDYSELDTAIKFLDIIFMLIIPTIITFCFNYIYGVI